MFKLPYSALSAAAAFAFSLIGGTGFADTIDPTSYTNNTLGVGENVTITKTVNVTTAFTTGLSTYDSVTIDDLGGGGGIIDVSVACLLADGLDCTGSDTAVGSYDRSVDRTFTFDVTFTRTAAGNASFDIFALVNGGIVASEADSFGNPTTGVVPLPAAGWLMLAGFGGLAALRRRKKAA